MADRQVGDLVLTRSAGAVGALIRFGERVRYHGWAVAAGRAMQVLLRRPVAEDRTDPSWVNHAAVYVGNGHLIEALAKGLQLSPADKYAPGCSIDVPLTAVRPDVSDVERQALAGFARAQLGRHDRYGWLSIASIVAQLLTPAKLDVSWDGALICSAFAAQCWEHAGVTLPTRSSLTTMPADLAAMAGATPKEQP